jgi:hypothetical protein
VAKNKHERKTTPTEAFMPAGVTIRDEVIAELPAGIDVEGAATEQELDGALPPRAQGTVPERTVADRMRERVEGMG